MRNRIVLVLLGSAVAAAALVPAMGAGSHQLLVKFKGGIGVDPISNVTVTDGTTTATANMPRGIPPAGGLWQIADLSAVIGVDGSIHVHGTGLLRAGGNGIGTAFTQNVFATLFCGAPNESPIASSSNETGVPSDVDGDFSIDDVLSPTPADPCDYPVLLIRWAGGTQYWLAAGIPQHRPMH
jgi:hypothetical protein